jgi:hypothetical protein
MKFFFKKPKPMIVPVTLSSDEEQLLNMLEISGEVGLSIKKKTNNKIEGLYELQMFEDYSEEPKLKGIKSLFEQKVTVPGMLEIIKELQSENELRGYHIFCCGNYAGDKDYFIGALKTNDQYECLRIFETNGINYDIGTDDIIQFFKRWETQATFSIIDAYCDRVAIQFLDLNFDLEKFSKEALELCPDFLAVIEEEHLMKKYIIDRNGKVDFWWD